MAASFFVIIMTFSPYSIVMSWSLVAKGTQSVQPLKEHLVGGPQTYFEKNRCIIFCFFDFPLLVSLYRNPLSSLHVLMHVRTIMIYHNFLIFCQFFTFSYFYQNIFVNILLNLVILVYYLYIYIYIIYS